MDFFWLVLGLFGFILIGGFLAFLSVEFIAMKSTVDQINTLSWYIKRWRRKKWYRSFILFGAIAGAASWLILHLVFELV